MNYKKMKADIIWNNLFQIMYILILLFKKQTAKLLITYVTLSTFHPHALND